jgi:hypothetical protein
MIKKATLLFLTFLLLSGSLISLPASACAVVESPAYMLEKPSIAAADADGYVYITGYTNAPSFNPDGTPLNSDNKTPFGLFIIKMDPITQSVSYSTWFPRDGYVNGKGIVIDAKGSPQVLVQSESSYPFSWSLAGDGSDRGSFITRFSPDGKGIDESYRVFSSQHFSYEPATNLARGPDGSLFLAINTNDDSFPVTKELTPDTPSGEAVVVIKISPDGKQIVFADRIRSKGGSILLPALDTSPDGSIYLTGLTFSGTFNASGFQKTRAGDAEGFVAKISPDGERLEYLSYLGGSDYDRPEVIRTGPDGSAYVAGFTYSDDFPLKNPAIRNRTGINEGFATKISADGQQILWSTYLGEIDQEETITIAPAPDGGAWVAGGAGLNMTRGSKNSYGITGDGDAFLVKISPDGQIPIPALVFGGKNKDKAVGLVLDKSGNPFIFGTTTSSTFPLKNAHQERYVPGTAMFAASFNASDETMRYATFIGGPTVYSPIGSSSVNNFLDLLTGVSQSIFGVFHSFFVGNDHC